MAREREGELTKGEKENDGQRGGDSRRESVHTPGMCWNKEETKNFNIKEKMKVMARERKKAFVEGKQHM